MFIGLHMRDVIMVQVRLRAMVACAKMNRDFYGKNNNNKKPS